MAKDKTLKIFFVAVLILSLAFTGSSLLLKVSVTDDDINYTVEYLEQSESVEVLNQVNSTIRNTGTVGCKYGLETVYSYGNNTQRAFSDTKALWPGGDTGFQAYEIPLNYTGEVESVKYIRFCGKRRMVENSTYNIEDRNTVPDNRIKSTTLNSNSSGAEVRVKDTEGKLVPVEYPTAWKVSTSDVEKSKATLSYQPEIFSRRENITYVVLNEENEILGSTKVNLTPRKTIFDTLSSNILEIALIISILINIVLGFRRGFPRFLEEQFKLGNS